MQFQRTNSLSELLRNGVVIWRPIVCIHELPTPRTASVTLADVKFSIANKGSYMASCVMPGFRCFEPECITKKSTTGGVTIFLDNKPSKDWTHLIVTGCTHALKEPFDSHKSRNGAIFCKYGKIDLKKYISFRKKTEKALAAEVLPSLSRVLSIKSNITHPSIPNSRFLIIKESKQQGIVFEYEEQT